MASWPNVALGQEPIHYEVRARIDPSAGTVDADVDIRVAVSDSQSELHLWLYADRLAVEPSGMTEMSARWVYPGEVDLGSATVDGTTIDGVSVAARVDFNSNRDAGGSELIVNIPSGASREIAFHCHCG
ncbi:MAG: hypothetical protein IPK60_20200 [Sandaracinaceae bacterium]|nr:hypothetical protein [Sandaracinaceae bacterium]